MNIISETQHSKGKKATKDPLHNILTFSPHWQGRPSRPVAPHNSAKFTLKYEVSDASSVTHMSLASFPRQLLPKGRGIETLRRVFEVTRKTLDISKERCSNETFLAFKSFQGI